jgi:hypothetical protein
VSILSICERAGIVRWAAGHEVGGGVAGLKTSARWNDKAGGCRVGRVVALRGRPSSGGTMAPDPFRIHNSLYLFAVQLIPKVWKLTPPSASRVTNEIPRNPQMRGSGSYRPRYSCGWPAAARVRKVRGGWRWWPRGATGRRRWMWTVCSG